MFIGRKKADGNVLVAQMVVPAQQKQTGKKVVAAIRQTDERIFLKSCLKKRIVHRDRKEQANREVWRKMRKTIDGSFRKRGCQPLMCLTYFVC